MIKGEGEVVPVFFYPSITPWRRIGWVEV